MLAERVFQLEKQLALARYEKKIDDELLQLLSADLALLRKKFFDKSSEKKPSHNAANSKRGRSSIVHNNKVVEHIPAGSNSELVQEEIIHSELPVKGLDEDGNGVCDCGDGVFEHMRGAYEESSEIDVHDRVYLIRKHKRQKCKCSNCGKILTAKGPLKLKPGAEFSVQMAVQVADDKFHRHIPLNRQTEMMASRGLLVSTKTLFGLTEHLMNLLKNIPTMIRSEIHGRAHIHIDESPMDLLNPKTKGYVWSITNQLGAYYQYETTRSGKVAKELIADYRGIVVADGYSGYEFLEKNENITLSLCMAHVRRKFFDARNSYPPVEEILSLFEQLYDVEHAAKTIAELGKLRSEKSSVVMNQMEAWIKAQAGKYLDNSPIGKAIYHVSENWNRLSRFVKDPLIPIDNNSAERSQRRPVMGRRNFQGFRTINGADTGMFFYTIIESCKVIGVAPNLYMLEMALRSLKGETILSPYQYALELNAKIEEDIPPQRIMPTYQ